MNYIIMLLLFSFNVLALDVPRLDSPVVDLANVLTSDEKTQLSQKIRHFWEKDKQVQMSILIIPSLEGEVLEEYSIKVAEKWKLGTKDKDNGVLVLLAMNERKIRIEVGNGIEGIITDAKSRRLIEGMKSYMRSSNYFQALDDVVTEINTEMLRNTPEALEQAILDKEEEMKRRAESIEKLKENIFNFVVVGFCVLFFGLICKNVNDYFEIPPRIRQLQSQSKKIEEDIKNIEEVIENKRNIANTLKEDPERRHSYDVHSYNRKLVNEKARVVSNIMKMKSYLKL